MRLGYKLDESGHEVMATTIMPVHIRDVDAELAVKVNADISYPLSSKHNKGFHVTVRGINEDFFTELDVYDATTEDELKQAVINKFGSQDEFLMLKSAQAGETFNFNTPVYNKTAIDNHCYSGWDDDLEDLQDHPEQVVSVVLNDHLQWQVV